MSESVSVERPITSGFLRSTLAIESPLAVR